MPVGNKGAQSGNSYSVMNKLSDRRRGSAGRGRSSDTTQKKINKEDAKSADRSGQVSSSLSLAEKLWHLDRRLDLESGDEIKKLYEIYQGILSFDNEAKEKLRSIEISKKDVESKYEAEVKKITDSISINENTAKERYNDTINRLKQNRDSEILRQRTIIENMKQEKTRMYEDTYIKLLNDTQQAIAIGTEILNRFNINPKRYNVLVNDREASITSSGELLNRIRSAAIKINELESSASSINQANMNAIRNVSNFGIDMNNQNRIQTGAEAGKAVISVTNGLFKMVSGAGRKIKEERSINIQIKECSEEMIKSLKLLSIRKQIAKSLIEKEKPDTSIYDKKIEEVIKNEKIKYDAGVKSAKEVLENDKEKVTVDKIRPILAQMKQENQTNLDLLTQKHEMEVNEYTKTIDLKIKDFLNKLNNFCVSQEEKGSIFDVKQENAVEMSPENIYFNQKVKYKKMMDVYAEQKLINSLDLKLFLPEGEKLRDWYLKLKYDANMYQRQKSIKFEIDKIRDTVNAEYRTSQEGKIKKMMQIQNRSSMNDHEVEKLSKVLSDDEVLEYLKDRYKYYEQKETELYAVTTSKKVLGNKQIYDRYKSMDNITALVTNKEYVGPFDKSIFETCISQFDNKCLMFIYKDEEEALVMSNLIKNFIYNVLIDHHTESVIVNIINPQGDIRFKDLQISRDYVSTSSDTKGKIIKGPGYVKLFDTADAVANLTKDMVRQEQKLTTNDLVGKTFSDLVMERRSSGGIVPKFTINLIIQSSIAQNSLTRYNESGKSKGILNIYFTDKDTLIKQSYNAKEDKFSESMTYETMKAARTVKNIVEIKEKLNSDEYRFDVSYQDTSSHCIFDYRLKTFTELEDMRQFITLRSVKALKNKVFTTTTEFIEDVITGQGLKQRAAEQEGINKDKSNFDKTGSYSAMDQKYAKSKDFIATNGIEVATLKQHMNEDLDQYKKTISNIEGMLNNNDSASLSDAFKFIESYKANCSKIESYDDAEEFVAQYEDTSDQGRQKYKAIVYADIEKRQKKLDYKNEVNPKCYWEGDCLKTLPLYMGYVGGDKTKPQPIILDETQKPHYFIAGTTGGGKSVALGAMVNTLKMMFNPEDVEVVYFDFKVAEVAMHAAPYKMPQCSAMCGSAASEYLMSLLRYVNHEMDVRYEMNKNTNTNKLSSLIKYQKNKKKELGEMLKTYKEVYEDAINFGASEKAIEYIHALVEQKQKDIDDVYVPARLLLLVDEAAQAFQTNDDDLRQLVREIFIRLAQLARAAGIHILLVSQDADKMPDALMNLLKIRGCTVAPRAISTNVLKNDFCARPENQFIGFFGVNDMDGAEEANVQYVVPFNREEDTTNLTKIADSLCSKLGYKSRNAVIFDDNKIYTNELHNEQLELLKEELDGQNVFLGEGVYYMKKFRPHMMRFEEKERSGAVIISPVEAERFRTLTVILNNLKNHAYISPVYCREIPKEFPVEYFYDLPFNKQNNHKYFSAGKDILKQSDAISLVEEDQFDQFMTDDIFGILDDSDVEIKKVPSIHIDLDEEQSQDDYETIRKGALLLLDKVNNNEMTMEDFEKELYLNANLEYKDNALWRYKEVGLIDNDTLNYYNNERTFLNNVIFLTDSRKSEKKKDKNKKFTPMYFVLFDISKHKTVRDNAYSYWKDFNNVMNEASLYNIHIIIVDNTVMYHDREVGGYYLLTDADSLSDIPRKWKGVDKSLTKLVDITDKYSALVKLPKDDPNDRKRIDEERVLQTIIENIRSEIPEDEVDKYKITVN